MPINFLLIFNMMDKVLILNRIKEHYGIKSNAEFARFLQISTQNMYTWLKRGTYDERVLLAKCQDISADWLITGEGEMLKSPKGESSESKAYATSTIVPLLPVYAQGGSLNDFIISVKDADCEKIVSPIKDVDFAIKITGDSMAPEYPSGSMVLIKKVNETLFIEWGRVYVLDTANGTVVKQLRPSPKEGCLRCCSLNPNQDEFHPFDVSVSTVYGIYRVKMLLTEK